MDVDVIFRGMQWRVWLHVDDANVQMRYAPAPNGYIGIVYVVHCRRSGNTISPKHTDHAAYELFKYVSDLGTDEVHDVCRLVEYWDRQNPKN